MEEELYQPSEDWCAGKGGTQKDRDNGFGFFGQPSDFEEPSFW